jgi:hypothetical protein
MQKNHNPLDNISSPTLKRVNTLIRNAEAIGVYLGEAFWDYTRRGDVISFMLESPNGDLCIILCSRWGYLSEILRGTDSPPYFCIDYYNIKNIRNFLFHLKRADFSGLEED